jgi:hypothetical protein
MDPSWRDIIIAIIDGENLGLCPVHYRDLIMFGDLSF